MSETLSNTEINSPSAEMETIDKSENHPQLIGDSHKPEEQSKIVDLPDTPIGDHEPTEEARTENLSLSHKDEGESINDLGTTPKNNISTMTTAAMGPKGGKKKKKVIFGNTSNNPTDKPIENMGAVGENNSAERLLLVSINCNDKKAEELDSHLAEREDTDNKSCALNKDNDDVSDIEDQDEALENMFQAALDSDKDSSDIKAILKAPGNIEQKEYKRWFKVEIDDIFGEEFGWTTPVGKNSFKMTDGMRIQLEKYEQKIEVGLRSSLDVGLALLEISTEGWFLDNYGTLQGYMEGRWDMSKSRYYQLLDAARIYTHLECVMKKEFLPDKVHPLLALKNGASGKKLRVYEAVAYYYKAMKKMPDGKKPTASVIREVIDSDLEIDDVIKDRRKRLESNNEFRRSTCGKYVLQISKDVQSIYDKMEDIYHEHRSVKYYAALESHIRDVKKQCDTLIEEIEMSKDDTFIG